jgi:hypothetical protein
MQTYVVRVFTPAGAPVQGLHGTAVHLASGREETFADAAALIRFITKDLVPPEPTKGPQR